MVQDLVSMPVHKKIVPLYVALIFLHVPEQAEVRGLLFGVILYLKTVKLMLTPKGQHIYFFLLVVSCADVLIGSFGNSKDILESSPICSPAVSLRLLTHSYNRDFSRKAGFGLYS